MKPRLILGAATTSCALLLSSLTHATELGRLFYTPQQRAQLEAQQRNEKAGVATKINSIVVNGVIQKQGGNRIVWLNGEAQTPVRSDDNPARIDVAVPGKSEHIQLKVGQKLLLTAPPPAKTQE